MQTTNGTSNDDLLLGFYGFDEIYGFDGDDTIYGFATRDTIYGGGGDDRIITGDGPDVVYGGDGDDFILDDYTEGGTEVLRGGAGNDIIKAVSGGIEGPYGERTEWWMFGEDGKDKLIAGEGGRSHLYGGNDRDVLMLNTYDGGEAYGGSGNDVLMSHHRSGINDEVEPGSKYGPGGRAILAGGTGNDHLWGYSANSDVFVFNPGDGRDVIHNLGTGPLWGGDLIDLRGFDFDMTAQEVFDTYGIDRGDRIVLNFGSDGALVILDSPYVGWSDVTAQDVIGALWL